MESSVALFFSEGLCFILSLAGDNDKEVLPYLQLLLFETGEGFTRWKERVFLDGDLAASLPKFGTPGIELKLLGPPALVILWGCEPAELNKPMCGIQGF